MPLYRMRNVLEARGIKAFLNLEAGVTRGVVPEPGQGDAQAQKLRQAQDQIQRQNRQIEQLKNSVSAENSGKPHQQRTRQEALHATRRDIAFRYLAGSGLEIGALHQPLEVSSDARVRYVDRMTVDELREQYPELSEYDLAPVDIMEDGETLSSITDDSVDFVIANHMMEHCQNPIGALENQLGVLKPGGVLYMAVPDKRFTFDRDRPITPLEHVVFDYKEGPEWSKNSHFEEWVRLVNKVPEEEVAERARNLIEKDYSIHYHVWTQAGFLELLLHCQSTLGFPFEIELFQKNYDEVIHLLRKSNRAYGA